MSLQVDSTEAGGRGELGVHVTDQEDLASL
jgi:hypothetical protein